MGTRRSWLESSNPRWRFRGTTYVSQQRRDPQLFRAALKFKAPDVRNQQLEYVKPFVFKS